MTIEEINKGLKENGYIPNDDICYSVFEALALQKPILIEGDPGVGKTSLAIAVSKMLGLPFLRLQMYDGLTKDEILYDYDYQRQLLTLEAVKPKINEEIKDMDVNAAIRKVAGDVNFYINTPYDEGKTENLEVNITSPFNIVELYQINLWGKKKLVYTNRQKDEENRKTQLEAIVDRIKDYCDLNNIPKLQGICLPPLNDIIYLKDLLHLFITYS